MIINDRINHQKVLTMKKLKPAQNNQEARMNFVDYWADFVRTNPDEEWGKQQNALINSMLQSADQNHLSAKQYLKIKQKH